MTRTQLITDVKNMIGPGPEVQDPGLGTWLNDAYLYMCDQISQVNPDFFTKPEYTTTVPGQAEYALPSDFERLVMAEIQYAGVWQRVQLLPEINKVPVSENLSSLGFTAGQPVAYLYGGVIGFRPIPSTNSDTIKLWYVYTPSELTLDADVPAIPLKYHHMLKYGAYANYLDEDDQHGAAEAMRTRFEQRIQSMLDSMSANTLDEPKSVTISTGYDLYLDQDQGMV